MVTTRLNLWVALLGLLSPLLQAADQSAHPDGSVLLIAGQSREEFDDYLTDISRRGKATPVPGGAAFYTNLDLTGFKRPHANVPGDNNQDLEYLKRTLEPLVIQIGLWLSTDQLYQIAAGELDPQIARMRTRLDQLERPVFLRIGYEFDGPHNNYPPAIYVRAYRIIAEAMRGNPDILLVWHSFAMLPTLGEIPFTEWYPGDDYVDWIGISFFQPGTEGYHTAPNRDPVIAFARQKNKPVLIAEASPIRYTPRQKTLAGDAYWDHWFKPFFELIEANPEIRAVSIINVDWDSQRQHRQLSWGDCRLNADPIVLKHWREKTRAPYWMPPDQNLYSTVRAIARPKPDGDTTSPPTSGIQEP